MKNGIYGTIFNDATLSASDEFLTDGAEQILYVLKLTGSGQLQAKVRLYISDNSTEWQDAGTLYAKGSDLVYKTDTQDICYKYQKFIIEELSGTNAKVSLTYQY